MDFTLNNVLYVSDLNGQLIVIRKLKIVDSAAVFMNEKAFLVKRKKPVLFC